jgi:hypothetical protein
MSKRPFVPSFLQKIDDKLLRNKPGTWASRTHLVLYFSTVFALLLFVFCYFIFFDTKQYSNISSWNVFVGLIAFVGFVFWLIYLLRFNVFKRYGNWFAMDGLKDFLLYFICIGAMVAVCFIPSAVETMRANQQFGNAEIVKDINEININACRLEYNLLPLQWKTDTCEVVNSIITMPASDEAVAYDTVDSVVLAGPDINFNYRHTIDTAELRNKLITADSLLKINDSLYVFYECADYRFVSSYNADEYSAVKLLSSAAIYNLNLKNYKKPDRPALLKRMQELKTKYAVSSPYYEGEDYYDSNEKISYDTKIKRKFDLYRISNGIDNVVQKKYVWKTAWPFYLRAFYYTALLLTMLVFIFRHSTIKTFFLSVLTGVLLTIISGLILVIFNDNEEITVLSFMILYYIVFAILALSIFRTNVRNAAQGIALNLFLFMTPFVPLIFTALNRAMKYRNGYAINNYGHSDAEKNALYFLIAEIVGPVILLILIQPLFKKLYRKWYSAPEE